MAWEYGEPATEEAVLCPDPPEVEESIDGG